MGRQLRILVAVIGIVTSFTCPLYAATPAREFPYSKQTNLAPGAYKFIFSLYDSRTAAKPLWSSETVSLTLKTPVLVYALGRGTVKIPGTIDFSQQLYVKVVKTYPAPTAVIANRERLPSVPHAQHSASVPPGSITTETILDGTVTAADLKDGAALEEILDNDGGDSLLDADLLDGQHGSYYQDAGNIESGTLNDARLSGNVARLNTGGSFAGLVDFSPAAQAVPFTTSRTGMVANLNAEMLGGRRLVDISSPPTPQSNRITPIASSDNIAYVVAAIGQNGFPVIAYRAITGNNLKLVACRDSACSGFDPPVTVSSSNTGYYALAIGADGTPVLAFRDHTAQAMVIVKCGDARCSSGNTSTTLDVVDVRSAPGLAIGVDGFPAVAYTENNVRQLRFVKCRNAACSAFDLPRNLDTAVSMDISLGIGTDGLPGIVYRSLSLGGLAFLKCGDAACSSSQRTFLDGGTPSCASLTFGEDGLPFIAYSNSVLKVAKCNTHSCNEFGVTTVDPLPLVHHLSVTAGASGYPAIVYSEESAADFKFARCGNASCSAGNSLMTFENTPLTNSSLYVSIVTGIDGLPFIAYRSLIGSQMLNALKCVNPFCIDFWQRR